MARDNATSRRNVLTVGGALGAAALAGCTGITSTGSASSDGDGGALRAGGSSTVYPITSGGASVWNYNPKAEDKEYWGPSQYGIDTDERLADYFASKYGFEPTESGSPPFSVSVALSHSGVGLNKARNGQVDIGDASAPVEAELGEASQEELDKFTNHVVGVDAQPIVVSKAIYDAGVQKLTLEEVQKIYRGKIENWSEVGGPDQAIQAVGRAEGSGTDTSFRVNVLGSADAKMPGVDVRKGENQQVKSLVANSDNAIAYIALAFVEPDGPVPPLALDIDGTTYEYGKNLSEKGYPLARDLHCYTYEGTSKKEAAFLDMLLSDFGQEKFVKSNNYLPLTDSRLKEERSKLPDA